MREMSQAEINSDLFDECERRGKRVVELERALSVIASGHVDAGGNRRDHPDATLIAQRALSKTS